MPPVAQSYHCRANLFRGQGLGFRGGMRAQGHRPRRFARRSRSGVAQDKRLALLRVCVRGGLGGQECPCSPAGGSRHQLVDKHHEQQQSMPHASVPGYFFVVRPSCRLPFLSPVVLPGAAASRPAPSPVKTMKAWRSGSYRSHTCACSSASGCSVVHCCSRECHGYCHEQSPPYALFCSCGSIVCCPPVMAPAGDWQA